jgi:prophage regulatory protein
MSRQRYREQIESSGATGPLMRLSERTTADLSDLIAKHEANTGAQIDKAPIPIIYLRAADLAQRFGVHPVTVWKWVRSGNLPQPTKLGPGVSAWRSDVLERWEAERSAAKKTA